MKCNIRSITIMVIITGLLVATALASGVGVTRNACNGNGPTEGSYYQGCNGEKLTDTNALQGDALTSERSGDHDRLRDRAQDGTGGTGSEPRHDRDRLNDGSCQA